MPVKKQKLRRLLNWRRLLPWIVGLSLLIWIWSQAPWAALGAVLSRVSAGGILMLILLDAVIVLTMSGRWWLILHGLGYWINYLRLSAYRLAAFGVSYFTPGPQFGGEPLQAWVLTYYHNLPSSSSIASVTVDKLLELIANFTILAWGIIVVLQTAVLPGQSAGWTLAAALILWSIPALLLLRYARGHTPLTSGLTWLTTLRFLHKTWQRYQKGTDHLRTTIKQSENEVVQLCQQSPGHLFLAMGVTILFWVFWLLEFWFVYALLGLRLNMTDLLIVLTAARLAFLLPLPGGLGTLEASQVIAMSAIGQPTAVGLSAALIIRCRDILLGAFGLWLGSRFISGSKKN